MLNVTLYTDGACRGNPGPGGYGAVLLFTDKNGKTHRKEISQGYKITTNNRMELMAVIAGLKSLKFPCKVNIFSDSKYIVDAINLKWVNGWQAKGWKGANKKRVQNIDLWKELLGALQPHNAIFNWVKGHANIEENEVCDTLATTAADGKELLDDKNYTATMNLKQESL